MEKTKFDILFEEIQSALNNEISELPETNCEICKSEIEGSTFTFDDFNETEYSHICMSCAEKLYDEYKSQIDEGDAELIDKDLPYENWKKCESCGDLYPERELKDTNMGYMCDWCIEGDLSHGVKLTINYN